MLKRSFCLGMMGVLLAFPATATVVAGASGLVGYSLEQPRSVALVDSSVITNTNVYEETAHVSAAASAAGLWVIVSVSTSNGLGLASAESQYIERFVVTEDFPDAVLIVGLDMFDGVHSFTRNGDKVAYTATVVFRVFAFHEGALISSSEDAHLTLFYECDFQLGCSESSFFGPFGKLVGGLPQLVAGDTFEIHTLLSLEVSATAVSEPSLAPLLAAFLTSMLAARSRRLKRHSYSWASLKEPRQLGRG